MAVANCGSPQWAIVTIVAKIAKSHAARNDAARARYPEGGGFP
jgi:hypothetical protein